MKVLVVGSGGREAAIADTLKRFNPEIELFIAPGNGGTALKYVNVPIGVQEIQSLCEFALENQIDFTIVGPEVSLVAGIVDVFEKHNLKIFGPNKACAQFEGSKKFTKEFLMKYNIPTANYKSFNKSQKEEALKVVHEFELPVVIKADGLAAGKGVLICQTYQEAYEGIEMIFADKFKGAGEELVIESYLEGVEASLLCFVDGNVIIPLETARDYKRALDGDQGLNTGGMGGFSPNPIITSEVEAKIKEEILSPIIEGFKQEGLDYKGILFIGLMIKEGQPKVLEFNVRFGDPETQSVLPRLRTNLLHILQACSEGRLNDIAIKWDPRPSVTVVLASGNYPESSSKGLEITGLESVDEGVYVFHAGTINKEHKTQTNGGRILALTAVEDTLEAAREHVYKALSKVHFDGMKYRKDIGNI